MFRYLCNARSNEWISLIRRSSQLSPAYHCTEVWNKRFETPILRQVKQSEFYNDLEKAGLHRGIISAVDVDVFANAINDPNYLDELRDILYKLRLSAEAANIFDSTHYATVRLYLEHGNLDDLIDILNDRLNYGIFLNEFTGNMLLNKLIGDKNYKAAAKVAANVILQEDLSNNILNGLCLHSAFQYLKKYGNEIVVQEESSAPEKKKKVEEVKIRIKFLRNPYYDDHFDITDLNILSGKVLAWIGRLRHNDALYLNLQAIGWLYYQKLPELEMCVNKLVSSQGNKVFEETLSLFQSRLEIIDAESKETLTNLIGKLDKLNRIEHSIEKAIEEEVKKSIGEWQENDIQKHCEILTSWENIRQEKLEEQTNRLKRAKQLQQIEEKQKTLQAEEQKLWFFENEENIDLEIENKKVYYPKRWFGKKKKPRIVDENYIPPEVK